MQRSMKAGNVGERRRYLFSSRAACRMKAIQFRLSHRTAACIVVRCMHASLT